MVWRRTYVLKVNEFVQNLGSYLSIFCGHVRYRTENLKQISDFRCSFLSLLYLVLSSTDLSSGWVGHLKGLSWLRSFPPDISFQSLYVRCRCRCKIHGQVIELLLPIVTKSAWCHTWKLNEQWFLLTFRWCRTHVQATAPMRGVYNFSVAKRNYSKT